ncbi:hypothetical protein E0M21_05570 [Bacillus cereus]|nr:hypothetical protein E0M21_05570 [Bacillus cereus]
MHVPVKIFRKVSLYTVPPEVCSKRKSCSIRMNGVKLFYPALMGSKTPTSKFSESKEVRWGINCP